VIDDVAVDSVPAAGAIWSTAHDAGKWLAFLQAGGVVGGQRLVSEANFKELFLPQVAMRAADGYPTLPLVGSRMTAYGLGWFLQDYRGQFVAMHTGSMDGRTAIAALLPDARLGMFAFGNLDHAEFRHALLWKVVDLYTDAPERDWNAEALALYGELQQKRDAARHEAEARRVQGTQPSRALAAYAGEYEHPAWGSLRIEHADETLRLVVGNSPTWVGTLEHWHYDTFRSRTGDGRHGWVSLGFTSDLEGDIAAVVLGSEAYTFTRVRPPGTVSAP
jgi:hypothetical protein